MRALLSISLALGALNDKRMMRRNQKRFYREEVHVAEGFNTFPRRLTWQSCVGEVVYVLYFGYGSAFVQRVESNLRNTLLHLRQIDPDNVLMRFPL